MTKNHSFFLKEKKIKEKKTRENFQNFVVIISMLNNLKNMAIKTLFMHLRHDSSGKRGMGLRRGGNTGRTNWIGSGQHRAEPNYLIKPKKLTDELCHTGSGLNSVRPSLSDFFILIN